MTTHQANQLTAAHIEKIKIEAKATRSELQKHRHALRDVEPGDGTRYRILIVNQARPFGSNIATEPVTYIALLNFAGIPGMILPGYVSRGEGHLAEIDVAIYFTKNGTNRCADHTAAVVTRFINETFGVAE